ncbi:I78 family peptidase inhibitor [Alteriqipengyuania flavescens]|uniref:I78 family peptidase inhibitor n=1 Tax=Alteriqipengyuania flavescens TaxID=3053610 RepID=UPI0025B29D9D|nr:I78 family peptidase inhibitor [Alteriqipengyuania flavescens]WJY17837.1 I78 family peptidase inhibitor [Alteriqipengyuania flavescens]WJY23778.1 I78 family peptidase inhibitor [Alteriqipengyuania flavescens]
MKPFLTLATLPLLAACAATMPPADPDLPGRPAPAGECDAQAGQYAIGQRATAELGGELLQRTGARALRWGPPGAIFTMDFRSDRLNVMYDENYIIQEVRCG